MGGQQPKLQRRNDAEQTCPHIKNIEPDGRGVPKEHPEQHQIRNGHKRSYSYEQTQTEPIDCSGIHNREQTHRAGDQQVHVRKLGGTDFCNEQRVADRFRGAILGDDEKQIR